MKLTLIKIVATLIAFSVIGGIGQAVAGANKPIPFVIGIILIASLIGIWSYKPQTQKETATQNIKGVVSNGASKGLETFLKVVAILMILALLLFMIKGVL